MLHGTVTVRKRMLAYMTASLHSARGSEPLRGNEDTQVGILPTAAQGFLDPRHAGRLPHC